MAVLAWIKSRQVFLKIQEGIGENLSEKDIADGMADYVLWSTFCPESIDIDEVLDMNHLDGGMMTFKAKASALESLPECYAAAFDRPYDRTDVIVLLQEKENGV